MELAEPDTAGMLLYDGGRAPNPRRVQIFLAEKGLELPRKQVDINKLEQYSDEFVQMNPMRRVPVLVLADGTALSESVAICRYLEFLAPEPCLFGAPGLAAAQVEMWQRRVEFGLMLPVAFAFRHLHPGAAHLETRQFAEWGEANKPLTNAFLAFLDKELEKRDFVAGDKFSIADITAVVSVQFCKPARIEIPPELKNLRRWREQVESRPSVKSN